MLVKFPKARNMAEPPALTFPRKEFQDLVRQTMNARLAFCSALLLATSAAPAIAGAQMGTRPVLTAPPSARPASDTDSHDAASKPSSVRPGVSPATSPDYKIGPDDSLMISVWKEDKLSGTFPVRPDGKISLVLVGDVQAAGLTPMELSADLTARLKKFIQDPLVTVTVTEVKSQKVFVLGEVMHVGPIEMAAEMTTLQAISAAGGLSPYANSKKIYILRGPAGHQQKIPFNYKKAIKGDPNSNTTLQTGDTIVVP